MLGRAQLQPLIAPPMRGFRTLRWQTSPTATSRGDHACREVAQAADAHRRRRPRHRQARSHIEADAELGHGRVDGTAVARWPPRESEDRIVSYFDALADAQDFRVRFFLVSSCSRCSIKTAGDTRPGIADLVGSTDTSANQGSLGRAIANRRGRVQAGGPSRANALTEGELKAAWCLPWRKFGNPWLSGPSRTGRTSHTRLVLCSRLASSVARAGTGIACGLPFFVLDKSMIRCFASH